MRPRRAIRPAAATKEEIRAALVQTQQQLLALKTWAEGFKLTKDDEVAAVRRELARIEAERNAAEMLVVTWQHRAEALRALVVRMAASAYDVKVPW